MKNLVIFGANNFGKLIHYYLEEDHDLRTVVAYTMNDKYITDHTFQGLPVVPFELIEEKYPPNEYDILLAIGYRNMNDIRKKLYISCKSKGYTLASYFHSSCKIHTKEIGEGNIFLENCLIYPFTKIGNSNLFWDHVVISHDCTVGDFNTFTGYSDMCGYSTVENNVFLGKHSIIDNYITISDYTLVSAGAYVKKTTTPFDVVVPNRSFVLSNKKSTDLL